MNKKTFVTIFLIIVVLLAASTLFSCESESYEPRIEKTFSFYVYSADGEAFKASIYWGVNQLDNVEHVQTGGFASAVEVERGDEIQIRSDKDLLIDITRNDTGAIEHYELTANQIFTLSPF